MKRPFITPVYVADGGFLCGADHELISELPDATPEEQAHIVRLINLGAEHDSATYDDTV